MRVFEFDELLSSETWPTPPDQAPHAHEASSSKQRRRLCCLSKASSVCLSCFSFPLGAAHN